MKTRQVFLFILSLSFTFSSIAQILPNDRAVNWSYALPGNIVVPSLVKNIKTDFGAIGDGVSNDDQAFSNAFQFFNGQPGVLYIPSGNYLLSHTLNLPDNLLMKGESSSSTQLNFNLNGTGSHCIYIGKFQASSFVPITGGYAKGSNQVSVSNTSLFSINNTNRCLKKLWSWNRNYLKPGSF